MPYYITSWLHFSVQGSAQIGFPEIGLKMANSPPAIRGMGSGLLHHILQLISRAREMQICLLFHA